MSSTGLNNEDGPGKWYEVCTGIAINSPLGNGEGGRGIPADDICGQNRNRERELKCNIK
jgi:hypothetical protein